MLGHCNGDLIGVEVVPTGSIDDFFRSIAEDIDDGVGGIEDVCGRGEICTDESADRPFVRSDW